MGSTLTALPVSVPKNYLKFLLMAMLLRSNSGRKAHLSTLVLMRTWMVLEESLTRAGEMQTELFLASSLERLVTVRFIPPECKLWVGAGTNTNGLPYRNIRLITQHHSIMALNRLINERVGLGPFQLRTFLVLCLVDMNDGVELVLSSFLNPIIRAVFPSATPATIELLASIFYVGILCGSLTSGALADRYGRRRLIGWGAVLQIIVSGLFYLAVSLEAMLVLRFFYGFSFGFTVAVTTSMFAEISPAQYRGKGILLINFCISIGKLYAVILGKIFLQPNLADTNWKFMMLCGSAPNILVLLGALYVLEESPRYLLLHGRLEEGVGVLERMLASNKKDSLRKSEAGEIKRQTEAGRGDAQESLSYRILLREGYLRKAFALWLCWVVINFCFYGQLVIEAFHLSSKSSPLDLSRYFLTVAGELPSLLVSFYLIDHPNFGRRRSLVLFFLGAAICHLAFAGSSWVLVGSLARFFMKDVFQILYPLTTESFDTLARAKGFGVCSGGGRIGAIIMPFVVMPLDAWRRGSVYVLFAGLSIVAAIVGWTMVEQTRQKHLDEREGEIVSGQGSQLREMLTPNSNNQ